MQVAKWGNSLAVRLPAALVEALELKSGDEIEIHIAGARELAIARKPGREALLNRLRAFHGRLPADFKFDRDEVNARWFLRHQYPGVSTVRRSAEGQPRGGRERRRWICLDEHRPVDWWSPALSFARQML